MLSKQLQQLKDTQQISLTFEGKVSIIEKKILLSAINLNDPVSRCQKSYPTMTQSYIDTKPVSPAHGTPVVISEPLSPICETETVKTRYPNSLY